MPVRMSHKAHQQDRHANSLIVQKGTRCRECGNLAIEQVEACSACGSSSLYEVGVINEIVEMLEQTSAEVDFADRIDALAEAGEVAALLRY